MSDELAAHTGISWNGYVGTVQYGGGDRTMVVLFYNRPVSNPGRSRDEGRPIFEDKVYVRIHPPGERLNIVDRAATDNDRRRWPVQWAQFQQNREQAPDGTPIHLLYPDQPSIAEMLKAHGVHTIEQCANLSGPAIENIGMGSQRYCNDAQKYLEFSHKGVGATKLRAELEERDRRIATLERSNDELRSEVIHLRKTLEGGVGDISQLQALLAGLQGRPGMPMSGTTLRVDQNFDAQTAQINANHATARIGSKPQRKRARIQG